METYFSSAVTTAAFYTYLYKDGYLSVNYKIDDKFSKNFFINHVVDFIDFAKEHKDKPCYCTYNCLRTNTNRKNDNVVAISTIALDIEYVKKKKPEDDTRLLIALDYIKQFVKELKITNYMLTCSGNGYHLFCSLGKPIELTKDNFRQHKFAYNEFVKLLSAKLNTISNGELQADDRKDLAGILRIPTTYNTSAKRYVQLIDIVDNAPNRLLRKALTEHITIATRKHELLQLYVPIEKDEEYNDSILPKTPQDLLNHPLVELLFDTTLPDVQGWYASVIFALQAIVKECGWQHTIEVRTLQEQINSRWRMSVVLGNCSADNYIKPYFAAINFCKKNGFSNHEQKLKRLLKEHGTDTK